MELLEIRAHLVALRERQYQTAKDPKEWTQDAVADRAGVEQSNLSKIERLERPMTKLTARVLIAIIEKGLGVPLSTFFSQIEQRHGIGMGPRPQPLSIGGAHAAVISTDTLRAAGKALIEAGSALTGLSVGVETAGTDDTDQTARRQKSGGRKRRS